MSIELTPANESSSDQPETPIPSRKLRYSPNTSPTSIDHSRRLMVKIAARQGAPVGELGLNEKFDYFGNAQDRAFGAAALGVDAKPYQAIHRAN